MKHLLLTLTIAFSLFSLNSFANDHVNVAPAALNSFKASFKNASDVSWSVSSTYFKASFALNGQYVSAYFDGDGKMVAMTRNISSLQLPLVLQSELREKYQGYWVSDLFELANDQGTTYYITVENADKKIVLKSYSSGWSVYNKQCKS
ncbi:MAG TPA: hypothetical protein VNS32_21000 [Flavisolibacter sp.]|nr:hypothetical protein [Flavisolibacter sp.]